MGVTNGFLRLTPEALAEFKADASAFESACRNYDDPNYLDMNKAGYELLFILDPASVEYDNPNAKTPFPAITDVLSGGAVLHEQINLGYGPAKIVSHESLRNAIPEMDALTQNQVIEMALANEILPDVLMCDVDEPTIQEYHWPYLQSLASFVREAVEQGMVVIQY